MVLPLLAAVALRDGAGAAVRGVATRAATSAGTKAMINSTGGRLASNAVGSYGVGAIQRGAQNRQMQRGGAPQQDVGFSQWARENPNEATATITTGAVHMLTRSNPLGNAAAANTNGMLQSTQFH
jgi:hypothetical protein